MSPGASKQVSLTLLFVVANCRKHSQTQFEVPSPPPASDASIARTRNSSTKVSQSQLIARSDNSFFVTLPTKLSTGLLGDTGKPQEDWQRARDLQNNFAHKSFLTENRLRKTNLVSIGSNKVANTFAAASLTPHLGRIRFAIGRPEVRLASRRDFASANRAEPFRFC